ncbi:enoyl-CoA hydratase/isomerase family protein [Klenkia sp. PcliD-1-E]|uniref:enoyl-CoA hydratase/isomerase family protein n=1 Tax=Klenkia sp. PcliD-1-E TaxID=2954492 RepID=UPI002096F3D2|nr:enoyl-CoA hydratase/isomerase family protein [Klenkia sp. PcliD-1-E]MCO7221458.1 enoyl-CoA hydratase/isomerase family protein [Klenkia sp. PcliD-1-E]
MDAAQRRISTEVDGDVWRVVLDRPDAGNAIDLALADALVDALEQRPAATRAVLLLGNGPRFCVGGDVAGMAAADDRAAFIGALAHRWHDAIRAVITCPVPVVTGVQGAVAGAGIGLVGASDLVVCARSTKLRPGYGAIGLSPDGGTSWALTRTLGAPRALDLMLTNGTLTAAEAHQVGLVARLADDDRLTEEAVALAHRVAAGPVRAMVRTRGLVRRAATTTLDAQLDEEARLIVESAADAEAAEGIAAFAAKRAADFGGTR